MWRRLYGLHSTPDLVLVFRQLDQQRFLHLAQGHRSMRGFVAEWDGRPFNTGRTLVDARSRETWRKLTHQAARSLGEGDLGYTDPCGAMDLRRCICEYLKAARAVRCESEQIVGYIDGDNLRSLGR